jgi:tyrosine-specific transport protein
MTISSSEAIQTAEKGRLFGATLLVAGTCVGGGMLALPVETAHSGFFPSLLMLFTCWLFMTLTGLLYVEVNLWMKGEAHVMSMASQFLKMPGKILSAILYLFMGYASLIAYTCGGGVIVQNALNIFGNFSLPYPQACLFFAIVFGAIVYLGTHYVSRINAILVMGMIAAYAGLVILGTADIQKVNLFRQSWSSSLMTIPLILTTFSYQMIVPSLTPYLRRDPQALRKAIIYGTSIPFFAYALWQVVVLGTLPLEGEGGLLEALKNGQPSTQSLRAYVGHSFLATCGEIFAFFALVTSYLGISLGLFDFLSDFLKLKKEGKSRTLLGILVLGPSLVFAIIYPKAFLFALEISGGYGDTILNGIFPVLMVWIGRYFRDRQGPYKVSGGKPMLALLLLLSVIFLSLQSAKLF